MNIVYPTNTGCPTRIGTHAGNQPQRLRDPRAKASGTDQRVRQHPEESLRTTLSFENVRTNLVPSSGERIYPSGGVCRSGECPNGRQRLRELVAPGWQKWYP
jgi:hypothetical protein